MTDLDLFQNTSNSQDIQNIIKTFFGFFFTQYKNEWKEHKF